MYYAFFPTKKAGNQKIDPSYGTYDNVFIDIFDDTDMSQQRVDANYVKLVVEQGYPIKGVDFTRAGFHMQSLLPYWGQDFQQIEIPCFDMKIYEMGSYSNRQTILCIGPTAWVLKHTYIYGIKYDSYMNILSIGINTEYATAGEQRYSRYVVANIHFNSDWQHTALALGNLVYEAKDRREVERRVILGSDAQMTSEVAARVARFELQTMGTDYVLLDRMTGNYVAVPEKVYGAYTRYKTIGTPAYEEGVKKGVQDALARNDSWLYGLDSKLV